MTYCNMYACLLTVMYLNMWDGCAADVPLSRGSGSVLQQLQQLQQAGRRSQLGSCSAGGGGGV